MRNKTIAALLAITLIVSAIPAFLTTAQAAEQDELDNGILYIQDAENYAMSDYWEAETKTAPVKEGYVFGGWYTKDGEEYAPLHEDDLTGADDTAWAKFVPAHVMSVKAQTQTGTDANSASTYVRVITTTDSTKYQNIGFDIWYNNTIHETGNTEITRVFSALKENGATVYPADRFGAASAYFAVLKIADIYKVNFQKIIYVRPYWTTPDGTKVEGLARYIHVSDNYNGYLSVPVNLRNAAPIAAGMVTMTYDETLEPIGVGAVEAGRILGEINYQVDTENHQIKIVANSASVSAGDVADGIMANLRFCVKDGETPKSSYAFTMSGAAFANWNETYVDVIAEDYQF